MFIRSLPGLVVAAWMTLTTVGFAQVGLPNTLPALPSAPVSAELPTTAPTTPTPTATAPVTVEMAGPGCGIAGCPIEPACSPLVDQQFPYKRVKIYEEQKLITIPKLTVREVTTRVPVMDTEVEYKEIKESCTIMVMKPHDEEQMVTSMTNVPETVIDPVTGCASICYKQVPICKAVKVQIYCLEPQVKEYVIRVPVIKPVERAVLVTKLAVDVTTQAATCTTLRALVTDSDLKAKVPACPLPPIPHAEPCHGGSCHP